MAEILHTVFTSENNIFLSKEKGSFVGPKNRFFTVFKPIQSTNYKYSDFTSYLLNPVIDVCLAPVFLLDVLISVTNTLASLLKAFHIWSHNQQSTSGLIDGHTKNELGEAGQHFLTAISALISAVINPLLSLISLVTRPIASIVKGFADALDECSSASHRI
ncbi:hypothetical protein [Legionella brunensis]|uniref:Uncharacterized protein n=1 Tax=Legionella brunensis TaxID=29422 RepID=A0A0W0SCX1_9GAMM|nr:hypothetical protein [Legionella brunensis]KTC81320.1 hypothetical protein Lbru_1840 [Legionella brunensis]